MKKLKYFVLIILSVIVITGCGNKKAIDSDKFKKIMTDMDFQVVDAKYLFSEYDQVKEVYVALEKDRNYQIEFYVLDTDDSATDFYNTNKTIFEDSKGSTSSYKTVNLGNVSKYTLTTDGQYKIISRIGNTAVFVSEDIKYKDDINKILKKLGY